MKTMKKGISIIVRVSYILIWIFFSFNCHADETKDSLKINLFRFLKMTGELPYDVKQNRINEPNFFEIQDVLCADNKCTDKCGVYKFISSHHEGSEYNIFIKKDKRFEIYDLTNIADIISNIIILSNEYPVEINHDKTIKYIGAVISIYYNYIRTNLRDVYLEFTFGNYKYSINLRNYKKTPAPLDLLKK